MFKPGISVLGPRAPTLQKFGEIWKNLGTVQLTINILLKMYLLDSGVGILLHVICSCNIWTFYLGKAFLLSIHDIYTETKENLLRGLVKEVY